MKEMTKKNIPEFKTEEEEREFGPPTILQNISIGQNQNR